MCITDGTWRPGATFANHKGSFKMGNRRGLRIDLTLLQKLAEWTMVIALLAPLIAIYACSKQEAQSALGAVAVGLDDAKQACVWLHADEAVDDIKRACDLAGAADGVVRAVQADYAAHAPVIAEFRRQQALRDMRPQ